MTTRDELRALAEKANGLRWPDFRNWLQCGLTPAEAAYVVALAPSALTEVLDDNARLEAELAEAKRRERAARVEAYRDAIEVYGRNPSGAEANVEQWIARLEAEGASDGE